MKKKLLFFAFLVVVFSVLMAVPAFAACGYCNEQSQDRWWHCNDCCPGHSSENCPVCGESYTPGTCAEYMHVKCYECGECVEDPYHSCSGSCDHDWSETERVYASCYSPAHDYEYCVKCGVKDRYNMEKVYPQHDLYELSNSASCNSSGEVVKKCSDCHREFSATISALGHNYVDTIIPATCVQEGYTEHECSRCSDTYTDSETPATGHTWVDTTREEPTCTDPGKQHQACACGETQTLDIAALGHEYTETVISPTCTEAGYTTHTCSRCSDTYIDSETPATGHTWTDTTREEPTCTELGKQHQACACGETQSIDIPALGHDLSVSKVIPPTCSQEGYTLHKCVRCDESEIVAGSFVGKVDHEYRNGVCSYCGASSPNSGFSSGMIVDDEESVNGKRILSTIFTTVLAAATAALFDSAKKKK